MRKRTTAEPSYVDLTLLEERVRRRIVSRAASEALLRDYISESVSLGLSPHAPDDLELIREKWSILDLRFGAPGLLTEAQEFRAELLVEGAWEGLKSLVAAAGRKIIDGGAWALKKAAAIGGKAGAILKKIGGQLKDVIVAAIKQLPGGDIVLEFLSEIATSLTERVKEMQAAIGKQVEEFVKSAKEKLVDFFFQYVLTDQEMKSDVIRALGLNEGVIREAEGGDAMEVAKKLGLKDAAAGQEVSDIVTNPKSVDLNAVRDKSADVIDRLITFWLKLVEKNPQKYHEPFYKSGFFKVFGTGYGLASVAFLGILASSQLSWKALVSYVTSIVRGFKGGTGRPSGAETDRAGAYLFLGNKGNNYDMSLFRDFITGIIKGSNLEVITRVLAGDLTKIPDLVKRIIKTIVNGVKEKINDVTKEVVRQAGEGPIDDEDEEEVNEALGEYVDAWFDTSG